MTLTRWLLDFTPGAHGGKAAARKSAGSHVAMRKLFPQGRYRGAESSGVTRRQVMYDSSQDSTYLVNVRAACPLAARVGSAPSCCVRTTPVFTPVLQCFLGLAWPQTGDLKTSQFSATAGRQTR